VVPVFLFALLVLIAPAMYFVVGSFQDVRGNWTFQNIFDLFTPAIIRSYSLSIQVSLASAAVGTVIGFFMAYAAILGGLSRTLRSALMTFSGVASNFAGVPLALAFIYTLGRVGFFTVFLREVLGVNIYEGGFNLYTFLGLTLVYVYFQLPLMVLIIAPSLDGLKREWREASENLGASTWEYWRYIALPILTPSLFGAFVLLFGNAFGAYATAFALTAGSLPIVTIQIGAQIRGDVLHNANLGYALALGMVVIMAFSIAAYTWLQRRSARWLR
jgi:putative spermidine/putrescine transport system permease protein